MRKAKFYHFFAGLLLLCPFIISGCANEVTPSGGPRDTSPPELLSATPPSYSTSFSEKKAVLEFNEFIQLNSINNKLIISPHIPHPEIKLRGKKMIIGIPDDLQANTTYSFQFGDAIGDITENNKIANFKYTFSTGDYIDSMYIEGVVTDAYTLEPVKDAWVMLYNEDIDSLPLTSPPLYIARTAENGRYRFNNLKNQAYKMVAIIDKNSDYMYNLPTESIGFWDTLINPFAIIPFIPDTTLNDSLGENIRRRPKVTPIDIRIFQEKDSLQNLLKSNIIGKWMLELFYSQPVSNFRLDFSPDISHEIEYSKAKDSVTIWFHWPLPTDTFTCIAYTNNYRADTLDVILREQKQRGRGPEPRIFKLNAGLEQGSVRFNSPLKITFSDPVLTIDTSMFVLYEDSLEVENFFLTNTSMPRAYELHYEWDTKKKYRLYLPDSSVVNIWGNPIDSTMISFGIRDEEFYGTINLLLQNAPGDSIILHLLNPNNTIKSIHYPIAEQNEIIPYLIPGNYKLKAIIDENHNKKWDTGNYKEKIQPEKVILYENTITIRANWENEIIWDMNKESEPLKKE